MKGKKLLIAALTLAMLGTAAGGGCLMAAAADGPQVGSLVSWDGLGLNGTSADPDQNKTVITTKGGWTRALLYVSDVDTSMSIEMNLTANEQTALQLSLFDYEGVTTAYGGNHTYMLEAETPLDIDIPLTDLGSATSFCLAFYFDTTESVSKLVTINSLTVGGVSYQPTAYEEPQPEVPAPEKSFKEFSEWNISGGTATEGTLEKLSDDPALVDNGAAVVTFTSTADAKIEIPLSQEIEGWPAAWTHFYAKFKAENITQINAYIGSVENDKDDEDLDAHAFCFGLMSAWNATVTNSVTDGFKVSAVDLGGYFTGYAKTHDAVEKIVLVPVFADGAAGGKIEFGGMTFGGAEAPTFINDIGTPELSFTDWVSWDGYNVTQDGELTLEDETKYMGLLVSYTSEEIIANANLNTTVSNYDVEKYPKLHIGFYADHDITLGIAVDWAMLEGYGHTPYTAGYHEIDIDLTQFELAETFAFRFYLDCATTPEFEGEHKVLFDSITFHKDVEARPGEAMTNGLYNTPKYENGKLTWTYDAKDAGAYYHVDIPVENWYKFNRYLHINVTFSHEMAFGIWGSGNAFTDDVHQNSTHPTYGAGTYDLWLSVSSTNFAENALNNIELYCDVNKTAEGSLIKTVTVNSIEFVSAMDKVSSPNSNALKIDYLAQTVAFDGTVEVASDAAFTSKLASGAAVTPGATLYLRAADGTSAVTEVTLPRTELTKETAPVPTVGTNYIRFGATGYEYQFGDSTEWVTLGSWGNLTANTEYTVRIRIAATATSFASETVELKIKTTAAEEQPGEDKPGEDKPGEEKPDDKSEGCGSAIGTFGIVGTVLAVVIVGAAIAMVLGIRKKRD